MTDSLNTYAEKKAQEAEKLQAFSGLSLLHIRRQVTKLLGLIGREGIFSEYTSHDISHIDVILNSLEWIIPEETKSLMSPADWLMTVLAIYFHDLGMLVTKGEFENRYSSGFPEYRDNNLFKGDSGADYKAKIKRLSEDNAERFLYQEFVRHKHAERIQNWVNGRASDHLGISHDVLSEVNDLLNSLRPLFRRDLALICESHHLDDLNDFRKYKLKKPYGNSDLETANLQYCAILLRTADLLHMTSDRTPSIVFKVINPSDPISQEEWAKQIAVQRVCSKVTLDRENRPDESLPRDTIEVHAYFTRKDGFFGLTSYLTYVEQQLRKSSDWVKAAEKEGAKYQFPWRYVDQKNIETEGFIPKTFEFTFDQAKILDLLTGHTLYNDTQVVLRELVQNSIDAIRVQRLINSQNNNSASNNEIGKVEINWDSQERILSVKDDGTGMTQDIVEQNLLKVGASRYQDTEFKKQYPNFAPISRFGIGLLSAFMIADEVEIVTFHPEEEEARQLFLQSVHGKYLIQLLDKHNDEVAKELTPHGTLIKLRVRPSADVEDVVKIAKKWIVFPNCDVTVTIDEQEPVKIGFNSPKEALVDLIENSGLQVEIEEKTSNIQSMSKEKYSLTNIVRIKEEEINGVTVAYAVKWSPWLRTWSFLTTNVFNQSEEGNIFLGTCVEGIRVLFHSPGFSNRNLVAIANTTGINAPKTNVSRSDFEVTSENSNMLESIYSIYFNHIKSEFQELHQKRNFSLTWAAQESNFLLRQLVYDDYDDFDNSCIIDYKLFLRCVKNIPIFIVEQNGARQAISLNNIEKHLYFWTIDCQFFYFAESLITEAPNQISLSQLITSFHLEDKLKMPGELVVCGNKSQKNFTETLFDNYEIDTIRIFKEQRRIDCRWSKTESNSSWYKYWFSMDDLRKALRDIIFENKSTYAREMSDSLIDFFSSVKIGVSATVIGNEYEIATSVHGATYFYPHTKFAKYFVTYLENLKELKRNEEKFTMLILMTDIITQLFRNEKNQLYSDNDINSFIETVPSFQLLLNRYNRELYEQQILTSDFYSVIKESNWEIFDLSIYGSGRYELYY